MPGRPRGGGRRRPVTVVLCCNVAGCSLRGLPDCYHRHREVAELKPYYSDESVTIYNADCRDVLPTLDKVDLVLADPPYGDTSLEWDAKVDGWLPLLSSNNLWCFGSLRFFMGEKFEGWKLAQDIVWEKHNGSNLLNDRFRRIQELIVQFYRGDWDAVYKRPVMTNDALDIKTTRKTKPVHFGGIGDSEFRSRNGGPRLQRSVIKVRSTHGYAEHRTHKPVGIVIPLIEYSLPQSGIVLDPFMGSGTTLRAAKDLNRKAIGIELKERYCEIAANRMAQLVFPPER